MLLLICNPKKRKFCSYNLCCNKMRTLQLILLTFLILSFFSCRKSQVKIETTTLVNQVFFQEQLAKSINSCKIKGDAVWLKSLDGKLSNIRFIEKPVSKDFQLSKKDTLFAKPSNHFSVYFILKEIKEGQLIFDYKSQFNFNTFNMRKKVIDTGNLTLSCE